MATAAGKFRSWGRRAPRIACEAGKGFGEATPDKRPRRRKATVVTKRTVNKVLRSLDGEKTRPIDPEEAAKGRLDFATVKDWGPSRRDIKVEDLEVENFTAQGDGASGPFYARLVRTLEFLQKTGALETEIEQMRPLNEWNFEPVPYATTVLGLARAHLAVEKAIAKLLEAFVPTAQFGKFRMEAIHRLSSAMMLDRGPSLAKDFESFVKNTPNLSKDEISVEASVVEYEGYVKGLSKDALEMREREKQVAAMCKLIAHAFLLRIIHFTSSTRIAAAGTEKLQLIAKRAVTAYEMYPEGVDDPVHRFVADIDRIGKLLKGEHATIVIEELPVAFRMTSLFYVPLAREPDIEPTRGL